MLKKLWPRKGGKIRQDNNDNSSAEKEPCFLSTKAIRVHFKIIQVVECRAEGGAARMQIVAAVAASQGTPHRWPGDGPGRLVSTLDTAKQVRSI